jgi:tetratricopeptide (TPR) repeat protein
VAENPRIEALRRRVEKDPASIAFAQLAEEYRRAGRHEEAIAVCQSGLTIHPNYLSARVTLGRALIEVGDIETAEVELAQVLQGAPENLAAIRGLAEIHRRRGEFDAALGLYESALRLAPEDPDLEHAVDESKRLMASAVVPAVEPQLRRDAEIAPIAVPPALLGLEKFLDAIHTYRQKQAV